MNKKALNMEQYIVMTSLNNREHLNNPKRNVQVFKMAFKIILIMYLLNIYLVIYLYLYIFLCLVFI